MTGGMFQNEEERQETIELMLSSIREALEKPGSYFEFGQTIPWNLDKRTSMGVDVIRLTVYNSAPVKNLDRLEVTPEEVAEYVRSGG